MSLKFLFPFLLLSCLSASAEKCRVVDTTTNYKIQWDTCRSAQAGAQWLADSLMSNQFAVEHRSWWGRKWRVEVVPRATKDFPDPDMEPERTRPEMPKI